jgi:hypothetical protein
MIKYKFQQLYSDKVLKSIDSRFTYDLMSRNNSYIFGTKGNILIIFDEQMNMVKQIQYNRIIQSISCTDQIAVIVEGYNLREISIITLESKLVDTDVYYDITCHKKSIAYRKIHDNHIYRWDGKCIYNIPYNLTTIKQICLMGEIVHILTVEGIIYIWHDVDLTSYYDNCILRLGVVGDNLVVMSRVADRLIIKYKDTQYDYYCESDLFVFTNQKILGYNRMLTIIEPGSPKYEVRYSYHIPKKYKLSNSEMRKIKKDKAILFRWLLKYSRAKVYIPLSVCKVIVGLILD